MSEHTKEIPPRPWRIQRTADGAVYSVHDANGELIIGGEWDGWMVPFHNDLVAEYLVECVNNREKPWRDLYSEIKPRNLIAETPRVYVEEE